MAEQAAAVRQVRPEHGPVVVRIVGKVRSVEEQQNKKGWRFEVVRPAPDEFGYPTVYPINSKRKPGEGSTFNAMCELTSFARKVERRDGDVTYRDLRLFEVVSE